MALLKYKQPSGTEVEINDEPGNIKAAEDLGWKPVKDKKEVAPKVSASASGTVTQETKKE